MIQNTLKLSKEGNLYETEKCRLIPVKVLGGGV